jgi:ribose 5-phosphate isomerase
MNKEERLKKLLKEMGDKSILLIQESKGHIKLSGQQKFDIPVEINNLAHEAHDILDGKEGWDMYVNQDTIGLE